MESADLCTHRYELYATRYATCQGKCEKCPVEMIVRVMPYSTSTEFLNSSGELVVRGSDRFSAKLSRYFGSRSDILHVRLEAPPRGLVLTQRRLYIKDLAEAERRRRRKPHKASFGRGVDVNPNPGFW